MPIKRDTKLIKTVFKKVQKTLAKKRIHVEKFLFFFVYKREEEEKEKGKDNLLQLLN